MVWRPEGFVNPFKQGVLNTHKTLQPASACWCPSCGAYQDFERGADAMLEALKAKGIHGKVIYCGDGDYRVEGINAKRYDLEDIAPDGKQGTFLFIPDKESMEDHIADLKGDD
jgi:hypothetical protein